MSQFRTYAVNHLTKYSPEATDQYLKSLINQWNIQTMHPIEVKNFFTRLIEIRHKAPQDYSFDDKLKTFVEEILTPLGHSESFWNTYTEQSVDTSSITSTPGTVPQNDLNDLFARLIKIRKEAPDDNSFLEELTKFIDEIVMPKVYRIHSIALLKYGKTYLDMCHNLYFLIQKLNKKLFKIQQIFTIYNNRPYA